MTMSLSDIIIEKIQRSGQISFRDFMEMALYYPASGYYTSDKEKIGRNGDYYTASNLTAAFGKMIGRQLEEMWHVLDEKEFTVVEMGAGTGMLSRDVLEYLKRNHELYQDLEYSIVEKSPVMLENQRKNLNEKVRWYNSITELSGMTGCIFSNELVDAFPVHQVIMEKELMEVMVDYKDGFIETLKPASKQLKNYLIELGIFLPEGYRTEINLDAIKWIEDLSSTLKKGFVITIDYGYPSSELYQEYRSSGTLMCYHRHTSNSSLFENIGGQDITSHVNFSALEHWGNKHGLVYCGFNDMAHFLLGLGIEEYLKDLQKGNPVDHWKKVLQIKTLIMEMGETFKILIQKKGVECEHLSGMKFQSHWKIN